MERVPCRRSLFSAFLTGKTLQRGFSLQPRPEPPEWGKIGTLYFPRDREYGKLKSSAILL